MISPRKQQQLRGRAVDVYGGPVIDPTENVKALTLAAVQRIDDMNVLRASIVDEKIKRLEAIGDHLDKMAALREQHAKESRESEAKRLDAIRATDVAAVSTTAAQSLAAIQALASTATATAETLRNQVATTATTIANQTDRIVSPIMERLAALEKIVNIGQGRSTVADPQIAELATEMRTLVKSRDVGAGKGEGTDQTWKWIALIAGLGLALLSYQTRAAPVAMPAPVIQVVPYAPPAPATGPR